MERMGLVSRVEGDLERLIVLGLLPRDGSLPSEQLLARQQGVSRATAREALLRLAARGLVVQHPGRRSRVVPLSEAVTLENLSVILHGEGRVHPERRQLLEGYFALKRRTMVELLAACCEHASQEDLSRLEDACFALRGTAPWEEQRRWAEREFELLRLAALVADRPGDFLLARSLERAFWGMAGRLLSHLDCEAIRQWSWAAYDALSERDAQALRRKLPTLLQTADDHLIGTLVSARERDDLPQPPHTPVEPLRGDNDALELVRQGLPGSISPNRSACHTGSSQPPPEGDSSPGPEEGAPSAVGTSQSGCHTDSGQTSAEALSPELEAGTLGPVGPNRSTCHTGSGQTPLTEAPSPEITAGAPGAVGLNRSACHTGLQPMPPTGAPSPELEMEALGPVTANRSACHTGSCQTPPPGDASPYLGCIGVGNPAGRMVYPGGRYPGHDATGGAHMWSPVPWPLSPSPAADEVGPPGRVKSAPEWFGLHFFDDTQASQPLLKVTARPGQMCCTAKELHHVGGTRGASWAAVIELRWG